jgi:RNA polymerase sigma-70 factor (family 1)
MTDFAAFTDEELVALLKEGDSSAFKAIYGRYWSILYSSAYKRTRDKEQCQDIVQNVFTDLWFRKREVKILNLPAYLHTAVRFQLYKQIAKAPQKARYLDELDEIISSPIHADDPLREKEITALIDLWLNALPERRRQIFIMHYREEISTLEIANSLGISQNTVQAQLYTASQSLRVRLAQYLSLTLILSFLSNR